MGSDFKYDVFLSYSSKDKEKVHALAERLKQDGLLVWLDAWAIRPGDSIPLKIQQGLEQSRVLLMCMSPDYFASDWWRMEHLTLLFRDPTNAERRFIPLLVEDCALPAVIAKFAHIDIRTASDAAYAELLAACREARVPQKSQSARKQTEQARLVLKGHTSAIWSVAIPPIDGSIVVSGSYDKAIRIWDIATGICSAALKGHAKSILCLAVTPDSQTIISGSDDNTLKIWDRATGKCRTTLKGHNGAIWSVAVTPEGHVISASDDKTLRVWDLAKGNCLATFEGHTDGVSGVAIHGQIVVSSSWDRTLKVWDLITGKCNATFRSNSSGIKCVAIASDGKTIVCGSGDNTLEVWDLSTGKCSGIFEGHVGIIRGVAITSNGQVVSGSDDKTLKVWDLATGRCRATLRGHKAEILGVAVTPDGHTAISASSDKMLRIWDLPEPNTLAEEAASARYTIAKVVLVGDAGVGKTGLALRLCENRWEATGSTHGMIISRLKLPQLTGEDDIQREVWLWDFAGQADYRLINQLYMDETALGVLVINPQDSNPFEGTGYWEKALSSAAKFQPAKLLVAARCDRGGATISQQRFEEYIKEHGFAGFICTGAKTGEGCQELKEAIAENIPWQNLPWTSTTRLFKTLSDAILEFIDEKTPLVRLPELHQRLQLMLPSEAISEADLRAVVGLMQGQGVVQALAFGDFLLLSPAWMNRYASVVVRMAREHADEMGVVLEHQVLEGNLDYKDIERLSEADEKILLRAIVQTFLDHSLCIRQETPQGNTLVFPSYFRRDKPKPPGHPNIFVTYFLSGPLEDIYSTLVVRLSYSNSFICEQLWKDAADFRTPAGKRAGLAMTRKGEDKAEIMVYFEAGVPDETKVTFIKYVHEHLLARAQPRESVERIRNYVCPRCDLPLENPMAVKKRLESGKKDILCPICEKRLPLLDLIEEKFASSEFLQRAREMDEQAGINLDNESRELILVGHATAIAAEAGQIFRPVAWADWGIDGEIEFKDDKGQASGQRLYLQIKSGDSYLYQRRRDDAEIFTIKNPRHAEYWLSQAYPVMLVIRTSDGRIRWMNVTDYLKEHGKETKQIAFQGDPFTALSVVALRDILLDRKSAKQSIREKESIKKILIKQATVHKDPDIRQSSLIQLAKNWPDEETRSLIQQSSIKDSDSSVRNIALQKLVEMWPDINTRELVSQRATIDESYAIRSFAVQALADKWSDDATLELLIGIAMEDFNEEVRYASCEALLNRWWNKLRIRQLIRKLAKIDPSIAFRQRLISFIERDTTRDQLSGRWEAKLSGQKINYDIPEVLPGYPAFRVLRFRLRDIGPFHDTKEVILRKDVNVFLGENAAGKTTILKCLALATIGAAAANEVEEKAAGYLRKGAQRGIIEVLFELLPDFESLYHEVVHFVVGLEIVAGATRFTPLHDSEITLERPGLKSKRLPNSAEHLGMLRTKIGFTFGFICAYGATRTLSESSYAPQQELEKPENDWVFSLFHPAAWLVNSEVFSKLIHGDTSNFMVSPPEGLTADLVDALHNGLKHMLPKVEVTYKKGDTDLRLNQEDLQFENLSDGYRSVLAMVGHLLRCSLRLLSWKYDPTDISGIALIDEIDLHLHPAWQKHVVQDLRKAFPHMQLIASTHSPLVVGALDANSVFLIRVEGSEAEIVNLSSVLSETESMKVWRSDQILTGPGFNLETSMSDEGDNWENEYETLWRIPKEKRTNNEKERLEELKRLLTREMLLPEESPRTREAMRLFEEWTSERLKSRTPDEIEKIVQEVKKILRREEQDSE